MDFIEYINTWAKGEVFQGKIMMGVGLIAVFALVGILRSESEFLRGAIIPMILLVLVLVGYGGYILYSRPAHATESISMYQESTEKAVVQERAKHINDNKAGKMLMRFVYPSLIIICGIALLILSNAYYRGMAAGFILLSVSTYIIDNGFVTRSDAFVAFLDALN